MVMFAASLLPAQARRTLDIYWIDVEGGAATLIIAPSGESLLVDTGFPGNDDRDAKRIAATAVAAGLTRIDNLVITHFHGDHVGGLAALSKMIPIRKKTCRSVRCKTPCITPGAAAAKMVPRMVNDSRTANRLERSW